MSDVYEMTTEEEEEKLKLTTYDYGDKIRTPNELGMRSEGSLNALGDNISGLIGYVKILTLGGGKALNVNKLGDSKVLGNKFFIETGSKCQDIDNDYANVDRSIYLNNVNNDPMGIGDGKHTGLLPGIIGNVSQLNPNEIFSILQNKESDNASDKIQCKAIRMEVIDNSGNSDYQTKFVTLADIKKMPDNWFQDNTKPSIDGFKNYNEYTNKKTLDYNTKKYSSDILTRLYFLSVSTLFLYIFLKVMHKR